VLSPQDLSGTASVTLSCAPTVTQYTNGNCDAGIGPTVVTGAGVGVGGVITSDFGEILCTASATSGTSVNPSYFGFSSRARLAVELVGGGAAVEKNICATLRVRTVDGRNMTLPVPSSVGVSLLAGSGIDLSPGTSCADLDAGLTLTLPANGLSVNFSMKARSVTPGDAGMNLVVTAVSDNPLVEGGAGTFVATCRNLGESCMTYSGVCCGNCRAIASYTCD
jgi:hypothetical protein